MRRVLVTGGGGYIGATLIPLLLAEGYAVRCLDRFFFGRDVLPEHPALECIREDSRRINAGHLKEVDAVIDLCAISNDPSGERFQHETWEINAQARARTAALAKDLGVARYILPSSCSVYGFQDPAVLCDESYPINPLTTYAKANAQAERDIFPLADEQFTVVILRQATVFGASPRMRFDLAINGMTYGAWHDGVLPLLRDGTQWRPMLHVKDAARAQLFMLTAPRETINGQTFNVGSEEGNFQLGPLAKRIASALPRDVSIEWYGDPDHRSYRVSFDKLRALGFRAEHSAEDGALEMYDALERGALAKTPQTITLSWYEELAAWHDRIKNLELNGDLLRLSPHNTRDHV